MALPTTPPTPDPSRPSLIASISSVLQILNPQNSNPNPNPNSPSPLDPFAPHLTPALLAAVIRSHAHRPFSALLFFRWAAPRLPRPPPPSSFLALADLLLSHRHLFAAASLLPSAPSPAAADLLSARLISAHGALGELRAALHRFHLGPPSLRSLNAALRVLVRANRLRLAQAVFDWAVHSGPNPVQPDIASYATLLRGYCKLGHISAAESLFNGMICTPNRITFNTLIDGYCRKGLMSHAISTVDRMVHTPDCSPDTITFTTVINGYCKLGDLEEAQRCMDEMVHRWKLEPNVMTYNSIINGLCSSGRIKEATTMMTRMRLDGIRDDVTTHTCLLKGLCILGRPECAARHLTAMPKMGMDPDARAYGVVIDEWCKWARLEEALGIIEEMRGKNVIPQISSVNALLRSLSEKGEVGRAVKLLRDIPKMGCSPNFMSYSTVITRLCGCGGRMGTVEKLVVEMMRKGQRPDRTMYSLMVEGYCLDGEIEMAVGGFRDMMEKGFVITLGGFEALVKGLVGSGREGEAEMLFEEMQKRWDEVVLDFESYWRILFNHLRR
ncbi:pentatricopeptide repeat-containing protein [Cocos nucifera]|uniref:Pentatricopeptide repeat-containing protein n=1 Tax=Cocos nucifera TaxID=13894 RepID=A0A8K0I1R1_COCNU|nr:pentatricopeptide repeat-containing protein [Cocos nucifera]